LAKHKTDCDRCEQLEKELHDYKSTIKTLRKRLRSLEKDLTAYAQLVSKNQDPDEPKDYSTRKTCPECKQGIITLTDLTRKYLETCDNCRYRRTIKKA